MTDADRPHPTAMILSVGGSRPPIVAALKEALPRFVLFVVSEASKDQVSGILSSFPDYTPQWENLTVSDHQDLGRCYREIRPGIADWMARRELVAENVVVDITGGTKPMSAALTLAAMEWLSSFRYVGGSERDADGLGIVVTGSERIVACRNPWNDYAVRETERASALLRENYADSAAGILKEAAARCDAPVRTRIAPVGRLVAALAQADRFDFSAAIKLYGARDCRPAVEVILGYSVFCETEALFSHWCSVRDQTKSSGKTPGHETILELIANSDRRAAQGRYDDATGRLYRAVELFAQGLVKAHFNADLGNLSIESVPKRHRDDFRREFGSTADGVYRLGVETLFRSLRYSAREALAAHADAYDRLQQHLQVRNSSLLAHGAIPVDGSKFYRFRATLTEELGVRDEEIPRWPDLSQALSAIPR